MNGLRAKDADRDRAIDAIEAAYVDGQIGEEDREVRVSRALSGQTLDELETLTRDLQRSAGSAMGLTAVRSAAPPGMQRAGAWMILVGMILVGVVLVGGVAAVIAVVASDPFGETSSESTVATATADDEPEQVDRTAAFKMTADQVEEFLLSYEAELDTLDAYETGFYPSYVNAQVPVRGSRPRSERWDWDGAWDQESDASAVIGIDETVDLGDLDVRRLFANIATAKRALHVERGELTHVLVHRWTNEPPTVNIYISNAYEESGHLVTTLSGDVVASYPFGSGSLPITNG